MNMRKTLSKSERIASKARHASFEYSGNTYYIVTISKDKAPIPHFHVMNEDLTKTYACLRIESAEYFDHGFKRDCVLDDNMLELIDNSLRDVPYDIYPTLTRFNIMVKIWNMSDNKVKLPFDMSQPDYTKTMRSN